MAPHNKDKVRTSTGRYVSKNSAEGRKIVARRHSKKRCPAGSRRSRSSGRCHKKRSSSSRKRGYRAQMRSRRQMYGRGSPLRRSGELRDLLRYRASRGMPLHNSRLRASYSPRASYYDMARSRSIHNASPGRLATSRLQGSMRNLAATGRFGGY